MTVVVAASVGIVSVPVTVILPLASVVSTTPSTAIGVSIETAPPTGAAVSISKLNDGDEVEVFPLVSDTVYVIT